MHAVANLPAGGRVRTRMNANLLETPFARIGARLKVEGRSSGGTVSLDVRADRRGEFFTIARPPEAAVEVLDVRPADRHLLLLVREAGQKGKFLCGHDERHWFVAALPDNAPVGTVPQAKEALKPAAVHAAQARQRLKGAARARRKNAAFRRQGEWFFLPAPGLVVDEKLVRRNEPLVRSGGGKAHWAEFCYRYGGELVYVCPRYPNGVTAAQYGRILARNPRAKGWGWRAMERNPDVFVRGRVRHPDHKAIVLHGWHRVLMNTEGQSQARRNVAFLD
jgi:hypothetical protein